SYLSCVHYLTHTLASFSVYCYADHLDLHSFPTRRSSDLTYLRVLLLFAPAFLCNDVLVCFVRNDGAPQLAMAATLSGSLANVVMDWFFIFPCGMGIFGAVLATGFSPVIGVIVQSPHWLGRRRGFHLRQVRPRLRTAGQVLALGVPSLLDQLSGAVVMITFNSLILGLTGNTGVAAYGVVANLSLVV